MDAAIKKITLRPMDMADAPMVEAFFDRMQGETEFFFNCNDRNRKFTRNFFKGKTRNVDFFLAQDGETMAAILFLTNMDSLPELGIAVDEAYQNRGLGHRLLAFAENYAEEKGKNGILLSTHPGNIRAQALYRKMKYERLGNAVNGEILYLRRICRGSE